LRAPTPDTPTIELPDWLPAPVRGYMLQVEKLFAGCLPDDLAILRRVATDDRMKYVWRQLRRRAKSDKALIEFFDVAWQRARIPWSVMTPKDCAALAAPYSEAAELCRWTKEHEITARVNPELAAAFDLVANHFDEAARREKRLGSPVIVKHHSEDDVSRAYVRVLGHATRKLFGSTLVRTVARTASVALDQEIGWRQVRNWTNP
jgi:hypothetical protein